MFEAQLLIAKGDGNDYSVFSPWMPRGGDNVRVTLELVNAGSSGVTITVNLSTKNSEDAGDGTVVSGSISRSGSDVASNPRVTGEWEGLVEELVRYKFTVSSETAGEWVLFRMLSLVWFDDVKA